MSRKSCLKREGFMQILHKTSPEGGRPVNHVKKTQGDVCCGKEAA